MTVIDKLDLLKSEDDLKKIIEESYDKPYMQNYRKMMDVLYELSPKGWLRYKPSKDGIVQSVIFNNPIYGIMIERIENNDLSGSIVGLKDHILTKNNKEYEDLELIFAANDPYAFLRTTYFNNGDGAVTIFPMGLAEDILNYQPK